MSQQSFSNHSESQESVPTAGSHVCETLPDGMVQSCITMVGFPSDFYDLMEMVEYNSDICSEPLTDLDLITTQDSIDSWTAPKWMTIGDIMLFCCSKKGLPRARALLRYTQNSSKFKEKWQKILERNIQILVKYNGTIFACAQLADRPFLGEPGSGHFKSRVFAPIERLHVFESPLPLVDFKPYVQLCQNTITPMYGRQVLTIRELLTRNNQLPKYLETATFGDRGFRHVTSENWQTISCHPEIRFLHEAQLRIYLLDFLLDRIKDQRTPRLEECVCRRSMRETGRADYMIKIAGNWIPVEAKLNVCTEVNLLDQVKKYIDIEEFSPVQGQHYRENISTSRANRMCLVADQEGLYVTIDGEFVNGCAITHPLWKRTALCDAVITEIRGWLLAHINTCKIGDANLHYSLSE